MSRRRRNAGNAGEGAKVTEYRHDATRKNIPPAGLAAQGKVRELPKLQYAYNPHLPPVLRSDATGAADELTELLEAARTRALSVEEVELLAGAMRQHEPWLEWTGKREKKSFEVEPVALHIHERISAQAILKIASRENVQREMFADPQQDYREAVQFYQHDVDWSNRMILGDSLQVMASLARREDLAGKVQMIYIDPPYGIRFKSNFQPEINKRDVGDREKDLTREPEMVKAYRDTWTLGVHSYLAYLRDRLMLAKELLSDSGSIFVQISDENLHRVRSVMDEVFGAQNQVVTIIFKKKGNQKGGKLEPINDYLLWYARDKSKIKFRQLFEDKVDADSIPDDFDKILFPTGELRVSTDAEVEELTELIRANVELVYSDQLTSGGEFRTQLYPIEFEGKTYRPAKNNSWKHNETDMNRVLQAERIMVGKSQIRFKKLLSDFGRVALTNFWSDLGGAKGKIYVVQTNTRVVQRCMLMTTDPGDLVFDPTCGSGTTAYVAEQWGRRWITTDTSRVALAIARQRLLTSTFPFYKLQESDEQPADTDSPARGFVYKTVPHITLKSIAQNVALNSIFAKHQPILDERLAALNAVLKSVTPELRQRLLTKLKAKEKREGRRAVTDADRRRWMLPKEEWKEWEVPFDTDDDWTPQLKQSLIEYRAAWRTKMDEVNASIAANAVPEDLVDQPEPVRGVVRVSGPFTLEAVMPAEESLDVESPIESEHEDLDTFSAQGEMPADFSSVANEPANAEAYLDKMLRLLRADGVRFPNNRVMKFARLELSGGEYIQGEGETEAEDGQESRRVAVSFGPQFGSISALQMERSIRAANRRGFDDLVFAGFSFDAAAQAVEQEDDAEGVRTHLAHIRPDVNMGDLLKDTPNSQLFTVFGSPRTELKRMEDGLFQVEMQGVDIYNPVDNTILPTNADKVAAWFLDTDYDGRTFCITQAFFPDKSAWDKLKRALKGVIDEEMFTALSGTTSLPFPKGEQERAAVKVIDPRGNEVMRVHRLNDHGGTR